MPCLAIIRDLPPAAKGNKHTLTARHCTESKRLWSKPQRDVPIKVLPSGLRDPCRRGKTVKGRPQGMEDMKKTKHYI